MVGVHLGWKFKLGFFMVFSVDTSLFILNTIKVFSEDAQSVINTFFIVGITLSMLGLIAAMRLCRHTETEKPVVRTHVWACLTFKEARLWYKRGPDRKPQVFFRRHPLKIWPDGSSQELGTNGQRNNCGPPSAPETADCSAASDATTTCDQNLVEDLEQGTGASDMTALVRIADVKGDAFLSPRSSMTVESIDDTLCCPCCLSGFDESSMIALLQCGHLFCEECIGRWAIKSTSCPTCRASMLSESHGEDMLT